MGTRHRSRCSLLPPSGSSNASVPHPLLVRVANCDAGDLRCLMLDIGGGIGVVGVCVGGCVMYVYTDYC